MRTPLSSDRRPSLTLPRLQRAPTWRTMSTITTTASSRTNNHEKGRRGRGRSGRGRGAPTGNRSGRTLNETPTDVAPSLRKEPAYPPAQGTRAEEAGDAQDDDDAAICWICAEPVKYYSVSACNHRTCHVCALRLRALYKKTDCTFCKVRSVVPVHEPELSGFDGGDPRSHSRLLSTRRRPTQSLRRLIWVLWPLRMRSSLCISRRAI